MNKRVSLACGALAGLALTGIGHAQTITFTPPAALEPSAIATSTLAYSAPATLTAIGLGITLTLIGTMVWIVKRGGKTIPKKAMG